MYIRDVYRILLIFNGTYPVDNGKYHKRGIPIVLKTFLLSLYRCKGMYYYTRYTVAISSNNGNDDDDDDDDVGDTMYSVHLISRDIRLFSFRIKIYFHQYTIFTVVGRPTDY